MRNLYSVIDSLLEKIPESETTLISRLKAVQTSCSYAAPEEQVLWWNRCAEVLNQEIPNIKDGWQKEVQSVFAGTHLEDIRLERIRGTESEFRLIVKFGDVEESVAFYLGESSKSVANTFLRMASYVVSHIK